MVDDAAVAIEERVGAIADRWRAERPERQSRRHLDRADFDALAGAGLLAGVVPVEHGGRWVDLPSSAPSLCGSYRTLAGADPSVALVSAMHPAVVSYWVLTTGEGRADWEAQRAAVFASALAGEQWGTITSEPGSGGDITKTRSTAAPTTSEPFLAGRPYAVTGDKHFGSGSGICHRMMTTAIPDDGTDPTIFVLDVDGRPWDGSSGLRLVGEWDGMGMRATQSHAMRLDGCPAVRLAWDGKVEAVTMAASPFIMVLFSSVVLGVLDEAVALARTQIAARADQLRAYEQVEWSRAEADHWLAVQAYEGGLRAIASDDPSVAMHGALRAKQSIAELAEATLGRLTRVLGGGTFSGRSPFAHWFEDVRALGFLRPPWALAADVLFLTSLPPR